jgi:Predicted membrane protein
MDSVLRAAAMYLALMVLFKIAGRRSLAELTTFDFVLLMMISEATQQALLGDDFSLTNSMLVIVTLIAIDVGLSLLKQRSGWISRLIDGEPTILVENGKLLHQRMRHARLVEADIMEAARSSQGIEKLEEIKFAIIERNGKISVIPREN